MQIEVNEYYYTLSCGCCSNFGVDLYLDGIKVYRTFTSVSDAYEYVLEVILGHGLDYYNNK